MVTPRETCDFSEASPCLITAIHSRSHGFSDVNFFRIIAVTAKVIMNEMGVYGISNVDIANGVLSTWLCAAIEKRFASELRIFPFFCTNCAPISSFFVLDESFRLPLLSGVVRFQWVFPTRVESK